MAQKLTLRIDLKSWGKLATVSIHKQSYKIHLDGMVEDFKPVDIYLPKSITEIPVFDSDNSNNQFTEFLDFEIDTWFHKKEGLTEKYENIIVVSE